GVFLFVFLVVLFGVCAVGVSGVSVGLGVGTGVGCCVGLGFVGGGGLCWGVVCCFCWCLWVGVWLVCCWFG
ncbi:hypothetical protein ACTHT8_13420, partial [Neisseria sp. P0021.S004]